jgi:hypothetical protein
MIIENNQNKSITKSNNKKDQFFDKYKEIIQSQYTCENKNTCRKLKISKSTDRIESL